MALNLSRPTFIQTPGNVSWIALAIDDLPERGTPFRITICPTAASVTRYPSGYRLRGSHQRVCVRPDTTQRSTVLTQVGLGAIPPLSLDPLGHRPGSRRGTAGAPAGWLERTRFLAPWPVTQ